MRQFLVMLLGVCHFLLLQTAGVATAQSERCTFEDFGVTLNSTEFMNGPSGDMTMQVGVIHDLMEYQLKTGLCLEDRNYTVVFKEDNRVDPKRHAKIRHMSVNKHVLVGFRLNGKVTTGMAHIQFQGNPSNPRETVLVISLEQDNEARTFLRWLTAQIERSKELTMSLELYFNANEVDNPKRYPPDATVTVDKTITAACLQTSCIAAVEKKIKLRKNK